MDAKTLVKVLKQVVREEVRSVIKEELTEILKDGLRPTINEIKTKETIGKSSLEQHQQIWNESTPAGPNKRKTVKFNKTGFADILNETDSLKEQNPYASSMNQPLNEDIMMTSVNAQSFGHVREKMRSQMMGISAPQVMADPETGKSIQVDPVVAKAMTRDYSALMKAMDKKKGRG